MVAPSSGLDSALADVQLASIQSHFVAILAAAEAITTGDIDRAKRSLEGLLDPSLAQQEPWRRVAHLFAASLMARLKGDMGETGNLYQSGADPDAMLAAFQTLVQSTPFIQFGYAAANAAIFDAIADARSIHIVDIGIGGGTQWLPLLQRLAARAGTPPAIRITGIDLPASGPDPSERLQQVGHMLHGQAHALTIPFTFEAIAAPVELVDFGAIRTMPDEILVVNAVFALHHLAAGDGISCFERSRDALLQRVCNMNPLMVTLVEPDVEHNALAFLPRVRESYTHYLAVFEVLATHVPAGLRERSTIEQAFFGREIRNIVVGEREHRVERHERRAIWRQRMLERGFTPITLNRSVPEVAARLDLKGASRVVDRDDMLVLEWQDSPLIAASAWQPGKPAPA